ncbi:hypothetical protein ACTA71_005084 [Dictyostelium dimigraforme]
MKKIIKKAEQLSNLLQVDLSDLIISSISHTTPKNPPPSLFKSSTPESLVLNSPIFYINNQQQQQQHQQLLQQQQQQQQQQQNHQQLVNSNNIQKNYLTMDLVNYFDRSSKLLSTLVCMLKSPDQKDIEPFIQFSIENSKKLPSNSFSNWINEILKAHTFYHKYFSQQQLQNNNNNNNDNGNNENNGDNQQTINETFNYKLIQNSESIHQQQNFFFKIIQFFVNNGNLMDALKIADEYLEEGAPD